MTIEEKEIVIGDGTKVHAITLNGSIPSPMMLVHVGLMEKKLGVLNGRSGAP